MSSSADTNLAFFERQTTAIVIHILLIGLFVGASRLPGFDDGGFLGVSSMWWAILTGLIAMLHQSYVLFCWRAELLHHLFTRTFGSRAFAVYAGPFFAFLLARVLLAGALGWSNRASLPIHPGIGIAVAAILCVPVVYLSYSLIRYFGFRRAAGLDHFEPAVRETGLVERGIYRFTSNAQYLFGFMIFWAMAFAFRSVALLVLALLVHASIWVHYFCTEQPDMRCIYGRVDSTEADTA